LVNLYTAIGTPKIMLEVNSIQQVFLNILINALDAVESSDRKEIYIDIRCKGEYAQIKVSDSGKGIPVEFLSKIFDPFFTTKPVGKGTGLGLSICQSVIKRHKGEIKYESVLGEGTTVTVLLPIEQSDNRRILGYE
jgi:two-component system, NtrC family, sensor kinase